MYGFMDLGRAFDRVPGTNMNVLKLANRTKAILEVFIDH